MRRPVACVDLGTNTCLLLVARRNAQGALEVLHDEASIIRLGEGVDRTGLLLAGAQSRALACLGRYAATARSLGCGDRDLHLVATSAMRDASNGPAFAQRIKEDTGFNARIISGDEEARLTWQGLSAALPPDQWQAAFDVGGGSTELMLGEGPILQRRVSVDLGSVRLTERFLTQDPPTPTQLAACQAHVDAVVASLPKLPAHVPLMGIAGTVTNLAACVRGDAHHIPAQLEGVTLRLEDVERLLARFAQLPAARRVDVPPMEPGRADVVVAGTMIVAAFMRHLERPVLTVGDRGVRHGLFWDATRA